MPFRGRLKHEKVEAWQLQAETELTRLRALTAAQLGAEVMRRGFSELEPDGERTRIGLSNSLCPEAPAVVGGSDIEFVDQFNALIVPALGALEDAGLLLSEERGRSGLRFYRLTPRGRDVLRDGTIDAVLAQRA